MKDHSHHCSMWYNVTGPDTFDYQFAIAHMQVQRSANLLFQKVCLGSRSNLLVFGLVILGQHPDAPRLSSGYSWELDVPWR